MTLEEEERSRFITGGYRRHRCQWVKRTLLFVFLQGRVWMGWVGKVGYGRVGCGGVCQGRVGQGSL